MSFETFPRRFMPATGIAICVAAALFIAGCNDTASTENEDCTKLGDCSGGSICWLGPNRDGECVDRCDPSNDEASTCRTDEVCEDAPGTTVGGCVPEPWLAGDVGRDTGVTPDDTATPPDDTETEPDDTGTEPDDTSTDTSDASDITDGCTPACGNGETCRDGTCVPEQGHRWVQIKDWTREENSGNDRDGNNIDDAVDACEEDGATGSDFFAVELLDASGQHLAWGQQIVFHSTAVKESGVGYDDRFHSLPGLNGGAPDVSGTAENACPSGGFDGNVAPLGCDGTMVLGFPRSDGDWYELSGEQTLRVYEYGTQCFESCVPTDNFAACPIEYARVKVCSASATKADLQAASPDGDRNYPGCTHEKTSFTSSGFGEGTLVLP